jgi:hypothetical protein
MMVGTDMRLVVALLRVMVGDWLLRQELVGKGLTPVTVMLVLQRHVLVGKGLFLVDRGWQPLVLVGGKMLLLVGRDLRMLIMALVLVLMCGTL